MAVLPYFLRNTIQMHVEKEHSKMTGLGHLQRETEQDPYIKEESLQRVQLSSQHLYTGPLSTPMLYMNTHIYSSCQALEGTSANKSTQYIFF